MKEMAQSVYVQPVFTDRQGRITVPKVVREMLGITDTTRLIFSASVTGGITVTVNPNEVAPSKVHS